jgi:hypothetical protein
VDRYLAGWQALLLNPTGRLVLINSVLDGLPTYLMAALPLLLGVQEKWTPDVVLFFGPVQVKHLELSAWSPRQKLACLNRTGGWGSSTLTARMLASS